MKRATADNQRESGCKYLKWQGAGIHEEVREDRVAEGRRAWEKG